MIFKSRVFVSDTCALGEGPFWFEERLWWVDVDGCALHSVDGNGENRLSFALGQRIGAAAPLEAGGFIVALEEGIGTFDPANGQVEILHSPEHGVEGSRFNDGKCDPQGRFLAGTLSMTGRKRASALYSLNERGVLEKLYAPVTCSNGLAWSGDGRRMYYIDTPTREIASFPYDVRTGQIGNRAIAVKVPEAMGYPDGMCIDKEGNLWVAHWGGRPCGAGRRSQANAWPKFPSRALSPPVAVLGVLIFPASSSPRQATGMLPTTWQAVFLSAIPELRGTAFNALPLSLLATLSAC